MPGPEAGVLFWVNLILLITVCTPYTSRCLPSDAKRIALLARGGPVGEMLVAGLFLLAQDTEGVEPAQWPQEYIAKLDVMAKDHSGMPQALNFLLADAATREDLERTADLLERALTIYEQMPPTAQRGFLTAASCYHGLARGDVIRAEQWLEKARKVKGAISPKDWDSMALAAIFYGQGDHVHATEQLTRYIAFLDRQPVSGPVSGMITAERRRTVELAERWALQTAVPEPG